MPEMREVGRVGGAAREQMWELLVGGDHRELARGAGGNGGGERERDNHDEAAEAAASLRSSGNNH